MSIESVMPSNHLILCRPLLFLLSIFPSIRVFSKKWILRIRWPKYWSFSISPSNEYSGLISSQQENGDLKTTSWATHSCLLLEWVWKRTLSSRWEDRADWNLKKEPDFNYRYEPLKRQKPLKRGEGRQIFNKWFMKRRRNCNSETRLLRKSFFFFISSLSPFLPPFLSSALSF